VTESVREGIAVDVALEGMQSTSARALIPR
jgi:hypothetical protein